MAVPVKFVPQHAADVIAQLGSSKPSSRALRYGCEIEVGWHSERQREAFLSHLGDLGLSDVVIAKHDGSIKSQYPCELVTLPLGEADMRETLNKLGDAIQAFSEKGLITQNCGVHFHVSRGPITDEQIWRYVNAIAVDHPGNGKVHPDKQHISRFWSLISLRDATSYCRRLGYENFPQFRKYQHHDRAVISGRGTPTYETRVFRTTRSKRVLMSYFDAVISLLAFCAGDHLDICTDRPKKQRLSVGDLKEWPEHWVFGFKRDGHVQLMDRRTGEVLLENGRDGYGRMGNPISLWQVDRGITVFYPNVEFMYEHSVQPPSFGPPNPRNPDLMHRETLIQATLDCGAVAPPSTWKKCFPLELYIQYVIENEARWPMLANRLKLSKFQAFLLPPEPEVVRDLSEPHLEFAVGCLVYDEVSRQQYRIAKLNEHSNPDESSVMATTPGGGKQFYSLFLPYLTHTCPGALEPGGEQ